MSVGVQNVGFNRRRWLLSAVALSAGLMSSAAWGQTPGFTEKGLLVDDEQSFEREAVEAIPRATSVKAILVAVTDDKKIGEGAAQNLRAISCLVRGLPGFNLESDLIVLDGPDATCAKLKRLIESIRMQPTDNLLVYVACHGGYDRDLTKEFNPYANGHLLQLVDGLLVREDLLRLIGDRNAPFSALITDTCNVNEPGTNFAPDENAIDPLLNLFREKKKGDPQSALTLLRNNGSGSSLDPLGGSQSSLDLFTDTSPEAAPLAPHMSFFTGTEPVPSRALADLMFRHKGLLDLSGTGANQFGIYSPSGGFFTIAFVQALEDYSWGRMGARPQGESEPNDLYNLYNPRRSAGNFDGPYEWKRLLDRTNYNLAALYRGVRAQLGDGPLEGAAKGIRDRAEQQSKAYTRRIWHPKAQ